MRATAGNSMPGPAFGGGAWPFFCRCSSRMAWVWASRGWAATRRFAGGSLAILLPLLKQDGVDVAFEVLDANERLGERPGHGLGVSEADEEGADQARSLRDGDGVHVGVAQAGALEGLAHDRDDFLEVGARGQLGHHTAVLAVQVHLRANDVREDAGAVGDNRGGSLVAG